MPYLGSVTFQYPVDWVDAKRPVAGSNYTAIDGSITTQKILNYGVVRQPITLKLSWIDHGQYETLYDMYNSVSTYELQLISGGNIYTTAFQCGADAFDFTPIVPEIPYPYRGTTISTTNGSYYDGTIKLICLGVVTGGAQGGKV